MEELVTFTVKEHEISQDLRSTINGAPCHAFYNQHNFVLVVKVHKNLIQEFMMFKEIVIQ